jgi:hypothetical protein
VCIIGVLSCCSQPLKANGRTFGPLPSPGGTTHACKSLLPEEVYLSIGFKADLSSFGHALKGELADLLDQKGPCFVNRLGVCQRRADAKNLLT